ncbi:MAG TPA: MBL fold metallo-hydrolase [Deltaproteobacteria bacterium]|nr:MBL fold metallo-hydrolase [Deltaproteobacteria bacterium]HPP79958.1 MBL fold metallo-hydrolase [Deltaproteobacteria bacterium]
MVHQPPARLGDRITLLGRKESCVCLLDGTTECALLGGGMSYTIPDVLAQMAEFGIPEERITRIIVLHTHFDHVGIVPFFAGRLGGARVCASAGGARMLGRKDVIKTILDYNQALVRMHHPQARQTDFGLPFDHIRVDEIFQDGQRVRLGDLTLEILEVPGHSSCSMAVYCPELKALFPSDASGIMFEGRVFCAANSNFDLYEKNLERMALLETEILCQEHYGALTGEDARAFMPQSREAARMTRRLIEDVYLKTRDVDATAREVTDLFMSHSSGYFLPREVMEMVVGQMTRFLARSLEPGSA